MALSTIDTNQIKDGGVTNADFCKTAANPLTTSSITGNTIASTENEWKYQPITVSATITINGVLTIV